uniref:Uncharacterized protein n=1 Tax=Ditylenchus dipsaci TaxID=166011 RepID=A0A915D9L3_9BILA
MTSFFNKAANIRKKVVTNNRSVLLITDTFDVGGFITLDDIRGLHIVICLDWCFLTPSDVSFFKKLNFKPCDVGRSSKLSCQLINEVVGRFHFELRYSDCKRSHIRRNWNKCTEQKPQSAYYSWRSRANKYSCIKHTEHVNGSLSTASFSLFVMYEAPSNVSFSQA